MGQTCEVCTNDDASRHTRRTTDSARRTDMKITAYDSVPINISEEDLITTPGYLAPEYESAPQVIDAFKTAVKEGNDSLIMHFIEEYPSLDLLDVEFEDGETCLHVAVKNKAYKVILCLLTYGVSPNIQNTATGDTALHEAVRIKSINTVTLLSKFGADARIENKNHDSALAFAENQQYDDIVELLLPETQELVAIHLETYRSDDEEDDLSDDLMDEEKTTSAEVNTNAVNTDAVDNDVIINPFLNLKRQKTKETIDDIRKITKKKNELPKLRAWLEKKQNQMPYKWQKRWVLVQDSYVLWSNEKTEIKDTKKIKERQAFNNWINLMAVTDVKPVTKGKEQTKFIITVGANAPKSKIRDYVWRCKTEKSRDDWIKGLQEHINHMNEIVTYLDNDTFV